MLFQSNVSLASADTAAKVESILRAFQTLPTKEEFQQATEELSATKSQLTREQHRHEITKKDLLTRNEAFSRVSQELGGANQRIADLQRQFDKYKLRMESEVTLHQRIDALASQLTGMSVQPTGPQVAVAPVPVPGTASNPDPFRDAAGSTPSVLPPSVAQKRHFSERKSATTSPGATRQQMPRLSGPPFINYVSPNNSVAKQNRSAFESRQSGSTPVEESDDQEKKSLAEMREKLCQLESTQLLLLVHNDNLEWEKEALERQRLIEVDTAAQESRTKIQTFKDILKMKTLEDKLKKREHSTFSWAQSFQIRRDCEYEEKWSNDGTASVHSGKSGLELR